MRAESAGAAARWNGKPDLSRFSPRQLPLGAVGNGKAK